MLIFCKTKKVSKFAAIKITQMRIEVKHIKLFGGNFMIVSGLCITIPVLLIFVSSYSYTQSIETIANSINASFNATGIYPHGMITYNVIFECDEDLRIAKTLISNKEKFGTGLNKTELEILKNDFPQSYTKGEYPYKISYRLPGKGTITSTINKVFKY